MHRHQPLDLVAARRWAMTARTLLAERREELNALNVFPVPDGDTGTNMFLTFDGALGMLRGHLEVSEAPLSLPEGLGVIARGMLLSARGNSGVILSQLAQGLHAAVVASCADGPVEEVDHLVLAEAFERADAMAWAGVTVPVEGTILSVSRAAAAAARQAAQTPGPGVTVSARSVAATALQAARAALERTPQQLSALARAGVVDAGGAGLVVVLEALDRVLSDRVGQVERSPVDASPGQRPLLDRHGITELVEDHDLGDGAYEVMLHLTESDPDRVAHLRAHLSQVGSSVLVVGGPDLWNVHVHLDDPQVVLEAAGLAGQVGQVRVEELPAAPRAEQHNSRRTTGVGVVACAQGDGLAEVFTGAGARVVRSAPGARASTGALLGAIRATEAAGVIVLPNDPDTILVAQAAAVVAHQEGQRVEVVASVAAVQGLAALAMLDPQADLDTSLAVVRDTVERTRYGAVTRASKEGDTPAGPCRQGQALGLVDGTIVVVADAITDAAGQVLDLLLGPDTELLSVVAGAEADPAAMSGLIEAARARHTGLEVSWVDGGQPAYPWLLGAE